MPVKVMGQFIGVARSRAIPAPLPDEHFATARIRSGEAWNAGIVAIV